MIFSLFKNLHDTKPTDCNISEIFALITSGVLKQITEQLIATIHDKDKYSNLKETSLPAPILHRYVNGKTSRHLNTVNPLIFADFDGLKGAEKERVIKLLDDCPFVYLRYSTPKGLRAFVRCDVNASNYYDNWKNINDYLQTLTGAKYDKCCSNINRNAILYHDSNAYLNEECETFPTVTVNISDSEKERIYNELEPIKGKYNNGEKHRFKDFLQFCKHSKDFQNFVNGVHLSYHALFGIATNLFHCRKGIEFFDNIVNAHAHYNSDDRKIMNVIKTKYTHYLPMRISRFTSYADEQKKNSTLVSFISKRKHLVFDDKPAVKISVDKAFELLEVAIQQFIKNPQNTVVISPTALGKTYVLVNTKHHAGTIIALKTHQLKDEIYNKMLLAGVNTEILVKPNFPKFSSNDLNSYLDRLQKIGLYDNVRAIVQGITKNFIYDYEINQDDITKAIKYLSDIQLINMNTTAVVLTTHDSVILSESVSKNKVIIFDEDPTESLLSVKSCKISTIQGLINSGALEGKDDLIKSLNKQIEYLKKISENQVIEKKAISNKDCLEIKEILFKHVAKLDSNFDDLLSFFGSKLVVKDDRDKDAIHFLQSHSLPKCKAYLVLSASLNSNVFDKLSTHKTVVIDNVEHKGKITQYLESCTITDFRDKDNETIKGLIETTTDITITFKSQKHLFKSVDSNIHFGNCLGYDYLKGRNTAVIGTPNKPAYYYALIANHVGIKFIDKIKFSSQTVKLNGIEFKYFTFENKEVQQIHLQDVHGELIQAVGRSRTLRYDCDVTLISNLPLNIAESISLDLPITPEKKNNIIQMTKKEEAKIESTKRIYSYAQNGIML